MSYTLRISVLAIAAAFALPAASLSPALAKGGKGAAIIKALDSDNDGTLDLNEVQAAATKAFEKADPDKDGTLDAKELKGRLSASELKGADPDSDGTLDAKEYASLVEALFKKADPDNDGTLDAKELKSKAGKALAKLLK